MERYDNYGVPRDIKAKFKFYGLYIGDLVVVAAAGFLGYIANGKWPISQFANMIVFDVLLGLTALFLIMHTNGGKRNYMILVLYLRMKVSRIRRTYKPIKLKERDEVNADANF